MLSVNNIKQNKHEITTFFFLIKLKKITLETFRLETMDLNTQKNNTDSLVSF